MNQRPGPVARVRRRVARRLGRSAQAPPPAVEAGPAHRYVLVVTYGRSGSTLVQGLLNTLPRTLVRGESNLYVLHLFRAWDKLREFRTLHLAHNPRGSHSAFYGLHEMRPQRIVASTRTLLLDNLLGEVDPTSIDVLGAKEVDWHRLRDDEVAAFFDFLERLMPGCLYVLNERDHDDVYGSGFWKGVADDKVAAKIKRVEEVQEHLRRTRPDRTLDVRFERVTSKDPAVSDAELTALAGFVHGSCPPELLAQLRETREIGHGPYPFGASRGTTRG